MPGRVAIYSIFYSSTTIQLIHDVILVTVITAPHLISSGRRGLDQHIFLLSYTYLLRARARLMQQNPTS